ncbi:MAG: tetratricopeptide repeat protein [Ignavibacteria bacterium]|nr:tetratricopeptide repeat protein [Ignavibacteria bacterium]MBT8381401.1 tetratricopeptide repeat protein [Ignavibacteria bacterium]NNL21149.1 tetratricopeptide repeat protein [Ignavibacteriaceae bacterium]
MNKSSIKEKRRRKSSPFWFYLVLILFPIIFFVVLEICLRLFNYGRNDETWIQVTETKQMLNPDVSGRYFYNLKNLPQSNNDAFDIVKKENAFRIMVMGGSSAAGFPYSPNGTFSRYLRDRLELMYPNLHIEVVNIAITATNSYTIRDLIPDVIEQEPDLILLYAGHNEYYGALGIGSAENMSASTGLVNFIIQLDKFKTVQLIRTLLSSVGTIFNSEAIIDSERGGTLMARIVKEKLITYKSEMFDTGISQFENNFEDILSFTTEANVPVIIGTVVSNLKDQKPFVSVKSEEYESAINLFHKAQKFYIEKKLSDADSLFRLAKDCDALRFRAPEIMNTIIKKLAVKYNCGLVNVDSIFNSASQNGIVGNNLIVDHLHPSIEGYLLMGKIYLEAMRKNSYLPNETLIEISDTKQDSIVIDNFAFSRLDSIISAIRLKGLLNDWPFKENPDYTFLQNLNLNNKIDSIAYRAAVENLNWEKSHREAAAYYLSLEDYYNFAQEYRVLISQYPFKINDYDYATSVLINAKEYDLAYFLLKKRYNEMPDAFSTKWLGTINLNKGNIEKAISLLLESIEFNNSDAQVHYNLSGAYIQKKDYIRALEAIEKCTELNPQFAGAQNLRSELTKILRQ